MALEREETAENRRAEKRRNKMLTVRLSVSELRLCRLAAEDGDVTMGEWARALLVDVGAKAQAKRVKK